MAYKSKTYKEEQAAKAKKKTDEIMNLLPDYCKNYYMYLDLKNLSKLTILAYARDLYAFFEYLRFTKADINKYACKDIPLHCLESLTVNDIEAYQFFLQGDDGGHHEKNRARHMATVRSFFSFLVNKHYIKASPVDGATPIKKMEKGEVFRLRGDEVERLMRTVSNSAVESPMSRAFCERTQLRDTAILTLLFNTGLRVSECVGINLTDINFEDNYVRVQRKGHKSQDVYFNLETREAIKDYINYERNNFVADANENALFLSRNYQRMTPRSIQYMIKKYAITALPEKGQRVTPHKARSSYGTALYKATGGDLKTVAAVLGHESTSTSSKYYIADEKEARIAAGRKNVYGDD